MRTIGTLLPVKFVSPGHGAEGRSEPERFLTTGNRIVVFVLARFRLKGSDEWQEVRLADVYTLRHGKIAQTKAAFADRQQARDWAGAKN